MAGWTLDDLVAPAAAPVAAPPQSVPNAPPSPYPTQPVRMTGPGAATNLSPSDDAALQAQVAPAPAPTDAPSEPIVVRPKSNGEAGHWSLEDLAPGGASTPNAAPPVPAASPAAAPASPSAQQVATQNDGAQTTSYLDGLQNAAMHSASFGLDDIIGPAVLASADWIGHNLTGDPESWGQSYDAEQAALRGARQKFAAENPIASTIASIGGGFAAPIPTKLFASAPAATRVGQAINFGRNAAGAGVIGGMQGFGEGEGGFENRVQSAQSGAEMGLGMGAGLGATGAGLAGLGMLYRGLSLGPILFSGARDTAIGTHLNTMTGGAPLEAPVLPGVRYNLGQATNNPAAAAASRWATETPAGQPIASVVEAGNNQALTTAVNHLSGNPSPAAAAQASEDMVGAFRDASDIAGEHARKLWGTGPLATEMLPTAAFKQALRTAVETMDPSLQMGLHGNTQATLDAVDRLPDQATARTMNAMKGAFQRVARNPMEANPQAAPAANHLAGVARSAIDDAINASGSSAALRAQYAKARAFTRRTKTVFGTQDARALDATNSNAQFRVDASEGAQKLFNFRNGSPEGARNIQDIRDFLKSFRNEFADRGRIDATEQGLAQHAREYIVSTLIKAAGLSKLANGSPTLNLNTVLKFLHENRGWMQSTGLFSRAQIDLADRISRTAEVLKRMSDLRPGTGNSQTYANFQGDKFADQIISPWLGRTVRAGAVMAGIHFGEGVLGLAEGFVGGSAVDAAIERAREALRQTMARAVLDPATASQLMMKATTANAKQLGPTARLLLGIGRHAVRVAPGTLNQPSGATPIAASPQAVNDHPDKNQQQLAQAPPMERPRASP